MAMLIGLLIAVPASVAGAIWPNRVLEAVLSGFAAVGIAIPTFVIGIGLIIVLGVELELAADAGVRLLPGRPGREHQVDAAARDHARDRRRCGDDADPAARRCSTSAPSSFVRTAKGKGLLRPRVVVRHELPNASIPAITAAGIIVAHLVGGAVIVEYVFARPGLGSLLVDSVYQRDYGVLQALVLLAVAVFIVTSLVVDVILGFIDPRLRTKAVT